MLSPERLEALHKIAALAIDCEKKTGIPMELSVAQCILESRWLWRVPRNNAFGIKAADRHKLTQTFWTTEVINGKVEKRALKFAAFKSLADAFVDYAWIITNVEAYSKAWRQYQTDRDTNALIDGVARVYATDPKYAAKIKSIAAMPEVAQAIAKTRATMN